MRGCATCAELEQLLEKTADEHWGLVLRRSSGAEPEQGVTVNQQIRDAKAAMDAALERYKLHLETEHSRATSATQ